MVRHIDEPASFGFSLGYKGPLLDLFIYYFYKYCNGRGYRARETGYEVTFKPYSYHKNELGAILDIIERKISNILNVCDEYGLDIAQSAIYKDTLVFTNGMFISLNHCKLMHPCCNKDGYAWINTGRSYQEQAHRVVAYCFIPNYDNLPFINHKNGIKSDNQVENLEWCTRSYNALHSYANGFQKRKRGENHHSHKLTNDQVTYIRKVYKKYSRDFNSVKIGEQLGVSPYTVRDAANYRTWKEVAND